MLALNPDADRPRGRQDLRHEADVSGEGGGEGGQGRGSGHGVHAAYLAEPDDELVPASARSRTRGIDGDGFR